MTDAKAVAVTKLLVLVEAVSLRRLIKQISSRVIAETWEYTSSREAEMAAHELNPNVVLIDIDSPKMSGLAGISRIRSLFPRARIIALTSFDHSDMQDAVFKAGADACLARDNLLQLVRLLRWPRTKVLRPT